MLNQSISLINLSMILLPTNSRVTGYIHGMQISSVIFQTEQILILHTDHLSKILNGIVLFAL